MGAYQPYNAAVVLTGVDVLRRKGWRIPQSAVREGLRKAVWPARFEVLRHAAPVFIVDGGHNPHGVNGTAESLKRLFPHQRVVFVIGILEDKDLDGVLDILLPLAAHCFTVRPDSPRALEPEAIVRQIVTRGAGATPCATIAEGIQKAMRFAGKDGVVCAVGSLYMAGEIRALFHKEDSGVEENGTAE